MTRYSLKHLTTLGLFFAIVLLQDFIPLLGNIPMGPFSLTLIGITVYTGALLLGPRDGAIIGLFWGLITFIRAFTYPSSPVAPLVFTNPLISILPKIVMGCLAPYLVKWQPEALTRHWRLTFAVVITEIVTAILTLGPIALFYANPQVSAAFGANTVSAFGKVLMTVIVTNAIPETILAAVVVPIIVQRLHRFQLGGTSLD